MNSLLPNNATELERAAESLSSRISVLPVTIDTLWSPMSCPAEYLPWLAWAVSVDDWDTNWSEIQKRNAINESIYIHQTKGTIGSIKRALSALGYFDAEVVEGGGGFFLDGKQKLDGSARIGDGSFKWFQYQVFLSAPVTIKTAELIKKILASVAPQRCELVGLNYTQALNNLDGTWQLDGTFTLGVA